MVKQLKIESRVMFKDYLEKLAKLKIETGYHYSQKGRPGNVLTFSDSKKKKYIRNNYKRIKKLEQANGKEYTKEHNKSRFNEYLNTRETIESVMYALAKKKLKNKNILKNPLYFMLSKDKTKKGEQPFIISPDLLSGATYHAGDMFDNVRKAEKENKPLKYFIKKKLKQRLLTVKELEEIDNRKIKMGKRKKGKPKDNYIEGHIWEPFTITNDNKIIPKR